MPQPPKSQIVQFEAPDVRSFRVVKCGSSSSIAPWACLAGPGLTYVGTCPNTSCPSFKVDRKTWPGMVCFTKGTGVFRPSEDVDYQMIRCSACNSSFLPDVYILYTCSARLQFCLTQGLPNYFQVSQPGRDSYRQLQLGERGVRMKFTSLIIDVQEAGKFEEMPCQCVHRPAVSGPTGTSRCPKLQMDAFNEEMDPEDIYFIQESIAPTFRCGRSVHHTVDQLERMIINAYDLPPLRVFEWNGKIHTENNRTLWAFKTAFICSVPVKRISISEVAPGKFTTKNGGVRIRLRPGGQ